MDAMKEAAEILRPENVTHYDSPHYKSVIRELLNIIGNANLLLAQSGTPVDTAKQEPAAQQVKSEPAEGDAQQPGQPVVSAATSDTPIVDAAEFEILSSLQSGTEKIVKSHVARDLERRLRAAESSYLSAVKGRRDMRDGLRMQAERAEAALAASNSRRNCLHEVEDSDFIGCKRSIELEAALAAANARIAYLEKEVTVQHERAETLCDKLAEIEKAAAELPKHTTLSGAECMYMENVVAYKLLKDYAIYLAADNARLREMEPSALQQELTDCIEVLEFYADPPCGEFMEDFSEVEGVMRPGKRARDLFEKYNSARKAQEGGK